MSDLILEDQGVISTSFDAEIASRFGNVVLQIHLPTGTPHVLIVGEMDYQDEEEIILQPGIFERLDSITDDQELDQLPDSIEVIPVEYLALKNGYSSSIQTLESFFDRYQS